MYHKFYIELIFNLKYLSKICSPSLYSESIYKYILCISATEKKYHGPCFILNFTPFCSPKTNIASVKPLIRVWLNTSIPALTSLIFQKNITLQYFTVCTRLTQKCAKVLILIVLSISTSFKFINFFPLKIPALFTNMSTSPTSRCTFAATR